MELVKIDEDHFRKTCNNHQLENLYSLMKDLVTKLELPTIDGESDKLMEEIIKIKPCSFNFRYPTNKDGTHCLPRNFSANIFDTSNALIQICDLLGGGCLMVENVWDSMCEFHHGVWGSTCELD